MPGRTKDRITKSFGDLIRDYQKAGYDTKESISNAYREMYKEDAKSKTAKKKADKISE